MTRKQRWMFFGGAAALVVAGTLTLARATVTAATWGPGSDVFRWMGQMHAQVHGGDPEAIAQWMVGMHGTAGMQGMVGMHAAMWGGSGPLGSAAEDEVPDAPATRGQEKVTVTATITEWSIRPEAIEVEAGQRLVLTVKNEGSLPHNFAIPALGLRLTGIAPGTSRTVELNAGEPGTYEVLCDIPGHARLGQRGTLEVVPAG